ncbi:hypothetical protein FSC37_14250 [Piscinibacter aquaticus]|uniref:Peptidase S9A N-terminal domain-containing protein n=1 Tax=Piscinibacter aquaticus TaxID=392597 RepID=A0A5C6U1X4_9BURK|nr:hypothetical protein FSC37_14250 [Piscinibacter aquaticus]
MTWAASMPRTPYPLADEGPIPTRKPHDVSIHGETRIDDWFWLRQRDDPEVIAHLHAENAHTEGLVRAACRAEAAALRRDARAHPGRRRRPALAQERLVDLEPHRQGPAVRDPAAPA